jgi:hypothetical protein
MDDNTDLKGSMMIGAEAVSNKDNAREFPSQFQDPFLQNLKFRRSHNGIGSCLYNILVYLDFLQQYKTITTFLIKI